MRADAASADTELVARIAAGDKGAMRVLFARHQLKTYRFVTGMVHDPALAEDVVNEVFLEVWRQASRFEGRSSVSTWLLGVARFKALSMRRRRKEDELDDDLALTVEDDSDTPEVVAQKNNKGAALRMCVAALSADHRMVVDLVYYHERSVAEVAEIMATPEATVKTRMFYARKKLAELMIAAGFDGGWP